LFELKVSWGVQAGEDTYLFIHVATSHSEALAWCVKFVKDNEAEWLANLR
jgi:hypothetical protein